MHFEKIRVLPGGDAAGGWMIDLHDGQNTAVYSPTADNQNDAVTAALAEHAKAFPDAPTESDYVPVAVEDPASDEAADTSTADDGNQTDASSAADPVAAAEAAPKAEEGAAPAASEANSQSADAPQA